jgi:colanic acid biosynthesis glycosyl transferase WcaI
MKILILGLNYAPEKVGIAVYTTGMAEALAQRGHDVRLVAGRPYYPSWKNMDGRGPLAFTHALEGGVHVLRVPHYVPAHPSGGKRLLHHVSFGLAALFPMLARGLFWRPDLVIAVAPSLIAAPVARMTAALCGARTWLHLQDFEVETAFATGLLRGGGNRAVAALWFESKVINAFHRISTISPQMCKRLAEKGIAGDKIVEFRNWVDLDVIRPMITPSPYRAEWSITTPHVALYSGNIANKQGIEIIVEAARQLRERKDLTFVVCGDGPNKDMLQAQAGGLENVRFFPLQPKERLSDLLGLATVHLLPQMAGAADLVLPSKLINMLASGRPVVATAASDTGLAYETAACGIITPPANASAFAQAIESLLDNPPLHARFSAAARERAEERWAQDKILTAFSEQLEIVTGAPIAFARPNEHHVSRWHRGR